MDKVIADPVYRNKVKELAREFQKYNPTERCARHIDILLGHNFINQPALISGY